MGHSRTALVQSERDKRMSMGMVYFHTSFFATIVVFMQLGILQCTFWPPMLLDLRVSSTISATGCPSGLKTVWVELVLTFLSENRVMEECADR